MTPNDIIDGILIRESAAYSNRPSDKGGPTRWGVTLATLTEWRERPCTADDVKNLSEREAREIYRERYINKPGFLGVENEAVRALAIDCAVNHGVSLGVQLLQKAARAFPDGRIGPNTLMAVNRMTAGVLYRRLCAQRVRLYGEIITRDEAKYPGLHLQAENAAGWANRIADFIEEIV